ncbi:Kinesin-like protein [Aphelenchoides fujianensis]|nr:Kinesin-like protein [Aphelenchoides fujianensis]
MTNLHPNGSPSSSSSTESSSTRRARAAVPTAQGRRQVYPPLQLPRINNDPNTQQLTVAVRIRPLNEAEKQRRAIECAYPLDTQKVLLVDPQKFENNILRQNRQHERQFEFDSVFGPGSLHSEVHESTTASLVDFVVAGSNGTVFAYGPTGSGKTFTMVGTPENPGLMTMILRTLYEKINSSQHTVFISFLEIYNEIIRDLLIPRSPPLDLLEDEKGAIQVPGLSRVKAPNTNKIMQILQEGNARRSQEPTAANQQSSRSHALLQVTLYKNSVQHGKLFLIDLAGSERAANSLNHGKRLKEGAAINRSLLALGNVINALSSGRMAFVEKQAKQTFSGNKARYVNFRDSKLTRLLKDSLGGNSKTIMLAHVTPSSLNYDETYNTLVYASRARNITTRITYNRPASADQAYSTAVREMNRQAATNGMTHAVSSHQISEKGLTVRNNSTVDSNINALRGQDQRKFASLFNSLKAQYLTTLEKQQRLRERLHKANQEAFDVEMNINSKMAILQAWEKRTKDEEEKYSEVIERLKRDLTEEEKLLTTLHETRRKTERTMRKNADILANIEVRLQGQARDPDRNELVQLLIRMGKQDAENMALASDAALQNLRLKKQESSLLRVQKYDQIAEKLISAELNESEREKLKNEYRLIRTQLNVHLIPLKQKENVVSWNSLILDRNEKKAEFRLPEIETKPRNSIVDADKPSVVTSLPAIPQSTGSSSG